MTEPLLTLADGVIISMRDEVWDEYGGCETCGGNYETKLELEVHRSNSGKPTTIEISGTDGAKAFTFVMRNLAKIPDLTINEFVAELRRF